MPHPGSNAKRKGLSFPTRASHASQPPCSLPKRQVPAPAASCSTGLAERRKRGASLARAARVAQLRVLQEKK